tara:strand:- start:282 stop:539 length:258 start_codon:yes stop_codon:yes gene_type:complete
MPQPQYKIATFPGVLSQWQLPKQLSCGLNVFASEEITLSSQPSLALCSAYCERDNPSRISSWPCRIPGGLFDYQVLQHSVTINTP